MADTTILRVLFTTILVVVIVVEFVVIQRLIAMRRAPKVLPTVNPATPRKVPVLSQATLQVASHDEIIAALNAKVAGAESQRMEDCQLLLTDEEIRLLLLLIGAAADEQQREFSNARHAQLNSEAVRHAERYRALYALKQQIEREISINMGSNWLP